MVAIITGVVLVGLKKLLEGEGNDGKHSATDIVTGLVIIQIGQIFGSFAYIIEEKLMGENEVLEPILVVAYEGVAGVIIWLIVLPILQFIPCTSESLCGDGVVEDSIQAFRDYAANPIQILYSVILVFLVPCINISGLYVTKYGSAA